MSSPPGDWGEFYDQQQNISNNQQHRSLSGTMFGKATAATATINASSPQLGSSTGSRAISKPAARRRSRASRRTPTTLLSTDTANFRAMVQKFTGGPGAAFAPTFGFSFGGPRHGQVHSNLVGAGAGALLTPQNAAYHHYLQYQQPYSHQQHHHQQQQQISQQPYMFSLSGGSGNSSNNTTSDMFFQRLGNPTTANTTTPVTTSAAAPHDGFVTEVPPPPSRSLSSSNENRSSNFLF